MVLGAIRDRGSLINEIDRKFPEDEEVIFAASMTYPALARAHERLREDQSLALRVAQHCHTTHIGLNLQYHVDDGAFLCKIVSAITRDEIFICRVYAASGKAILTSFPLPARQAIDWRMHCLGLLGLFSDIPTKVLTTCREEVADHTDWLRWTTSMSAEPAFGLRLHELNDIHIVVG